MRNRKEPKEKNKNPKSWFHAKSWRLNPNSHSSITIKACRSYLILSRVTGNRNDSIRVAFKFLNHSFLLEIPQINTAILWTTNDVFPICDGKCRHYAVNSIHMPRVNLQKLPSWVVPQLLRQELRIWKLNCISQNDRTEKWNLTPLRLRKPKDSVLWFPPFYLFIFSSKYINVIESYIKIFEHLIFNKAHNLKSLQSLY